MIKWNADNESYRVRRVYSSIAHGCGGWLDHSECYESETEARGAFDAAKAAPGTQSVALALLFKDAGNARLDREPAHARFDATPVPHAAVAAAPPLPVS